MAPLFIRLRVVLELANRSLIRDCRALMKEMSDWDNLRNTHSAVVLPTLAVPEHLFPAQRRRRRECWLWKVDRGRLADRRRRSLFLS